MADVAGIEIKITQRYEQLLRDLNTLQRRAVRPALNLTLSELIRRIRTRTVRGISSETQIPQKHFRKKIRGYNYGVRQLRAKAWIGLRKRVRVSQVAGMTAAKAERWKRHGPPVFKTKAKSGKTLFLQREGRPRYDIEEPAVNIEQIGPRILNVSARRTVNQFYDPTLERQLRRKLEARNLFDLSTFNTLEELFAD